MYMCQCILLNEFNAATVVHVSSNGLTLCLFDVHCMAFALEWSLIWAKAILKSRCTSKHRPILLVYCDLVGGVTLIWWNGLMAPMKWVFTKSLIGLSCASIAIWIVNDTHELCSLIGFCELRSWKASEWNNYNLDLHSGIPILLCGCSFSLL